MRAPTEADAFEAFVNAEPDELRLITLPTEFVLVDWAQF